MATRTSSTSSLVALLSVVGFATAALGCVGAGEDAASSTSDAISTQSIASIALANVGKGACSTNSAGGAAFETSCDGNGGQPEYWCADFAMWVWGQAGVDTSGLSAAAASFRSYGVNNGTLHSTPSVGDAVVFDDGAGETDHHVAIVTQVNSNGTIETVSGDWGGSSGSESYFSSTSHVIFNTPAYAGVVGSFPGIMGMRIDGFISPVGGSGGGGSASGGNGGASSSAPVSAGGTCYATVFSQEVPLNACVQNPDSSWSQCDNGTWTDRWTDPTACNGVYPLGSAAPPNPDADAAAGPPASNPSSGGNASCLNLAGDSLPNNVCVQNSNGSWSQCDNGTWTDRWTDPAACNGVYPL